MFNTPSPLFLGSYQPLVKRLGATSLLAFASLVACIALVPTFPIQAQYCDITIGNLYSLQGDVKINNEPAVEGQLVCADDRIDVSTESRVGVLLVQTQTVVRIDQSSTLSFLPTSANKSLIDIVKGIVHFFTRRPAEFGVSTPYTNAMVEGTEFVIAAAQDQTEITVIEGIVRLQNNVNGDERIIEQSYTGISTSSGKLSSIKRSSTNRAVYWAVHYPRFRDLANSGTSIEQIGRLLDRGQHKPASNLLDMMLKDDPDNSTALALQSIIATAQKRLVDAITAAEGAILIDPQSALGFTALSYANQASFDLTSARENAGKAVINEPDNVYALTRLAEVEISQGYLASATTNLKKALSVDSSYSRTYTLLGFVRLNQRSITKAANAFTTAIKLDNSDPLPQLGLGLTKIKHNRLEEGRKLLEIAVSLDPLSSFLRSYLGKAYYEEAKPLLADEQFTLAKQLDQNDPTPWYYDAISRSPNSTPIQELENLEKAIDLNDNRSIYRSRFALDSDLATRGVGLSRLYLRLGFNRQATKEATASLGIDPANHSAHRFLSDTYVTLPRHEIARVSELLQSQLLNPLNSNPIPPSRSFIYTNSSVGGGTAIRPGFNEYTSLFERNGPRLIAALEAGTLDLLNGDLVASWLHNNFSFSAGTSKQKSDGYRINNDADTEIQNVFSQWSPNNRFSAQAEYRRRSTEQGDLEQRFASDAFSENLRHRIESNISRVGSRFEINPGSTLLLSGINSRINVTISDTIQFDDSATISFVDSVEVDANQFELQHIFSRDGFDLITGIGNVNLDRKNIRNQMIPDFDLPTESSRNDDEEKNAYMYYHNSVTDNLDLTLGVGYSQQRVAQNENKKWQPKIGFDWALSTKTSLRAAYYKSLKRFLVADQSIEPTQIVGFNQLFDDTNGTESERLGIALNLKPTKDIALSMEATRRNVDFVIDVQTDKREETIVNLSAFWTISNRLSLATDIIFDLYNNSQPLNDFANAITSLKTVRVPVQVTYFLNHSIYFSVKTLFLRQDLERVDMSDLPSGKTDSIIGDLTMGITFADGNGTLTAALTNITDTNFRYQDDRFRSAQVIQPTELTPERQFTVKASYRLN